MSPIKYLLFAIAIASLTGPTLSSKILGYFITPSRSHFIIHNSLMKGLAARGHEVTVVSIFPSTKETIPNYRYYQLDMGTENTKNIESLMSGLLQSADDKEFFFFKAKAMFTTFSKLTTDSFHHPIVEKLKREEKFDLVALGWFMNDYQIGIAAHFKCPTVIISSTPAFGMLRKYVGNPTGAPYISSTMNPIAGRMTFLQRVINHILAGIEAIIFGFLDYFVMENIYLEHFPPNQYPSYSEAKKNVALVMVTTHFSQAEPTVSFPSLLEVSGMHIKKESDPLPKDIKEFLDNATDGAVFFSLGSNLKSTEMSPEKRHAILKGFSQIKQKVLWKWEDDNFPGKPANVLTGKWLPQDDILAHPNVVLFISHCGKGSINEAKYHGVPILGIPIFAEQPENLQKIVEDGWGVPMPYSDLNDETFPVALNEALNNPSYRKVAKSAAELFRDRPQHPLDTAIYWVEYVIRHNGAKHMQSQAVDLNWFQYNSLDVIGFLLLVIYVSYRIFKCCVKFVFRKCCGGKSNKAKHE